jgi:hypothetical protein
MRRSGEISRRRYQPAPVARRHLNGIRFAPLLWAKERTSTSRSCRPGRRFQRESVDGFLAGMLAYVAGIGALFAGLAVSFFVFFSTPNQPLETQTHPQSASAMLVRPSTPNKPAAVEAHAMRRAGHSEKHAAGAAGTAQPAASARDLRRKPSAAQARRLIQEERARRWAYQQDSSFKSRFLGYAD